MKQSNKMTPGVVEGWWLEGGSGGRMEEKQRQAEVTSVAEAGLYSKGILKKLLEYILFPSIFSSSPSLPYLRLTSGSLSSRGNLLPLPPEY